MPPKRQFDVNAVFIKSAKGHDEVARRSHGLDARQRQTLILIDGAKTLQVISKMVAIPELEKIIPTLLEHGLIEQKHTEASPQPGPSDTPAGSNAASAIVSRTPRTPATLPPLWTPPPFKENGNTDADRRIREVKDFMTVTAQTYLGLFGGEVIRQVETAKDAPELMMVVGHWHMALHESRQGKRFAAPYLEQVKHALGMGAAA